MPNAMRIAQWTRWVTSAAPSGRFDQRLDPVRMKGMNERAAMIRILSLILLTTYAMCADIPKDAQSLIDSEGMQEIAAKSEFDAKVAKLRKDLIPKLQKAQEAATKKGDLEGALAIKAKLVELAPKAEEKPPTDQELKQRLTGTFEYDFHNGHKGQLEIRGGIATEVRSNVQGPVKVADGAMIIEWTNNTQWKIVPKGDAYEVTASDGVSALTVSGAQAKR